MSVIDRMPIVASEAPTEPVATKELYAVQDSGDIIITDLDGGFEFIVTAQPAPNMDSPRDLNLFHSPRLANRNPILYNLYRFSSSHHLYLAKLGLDGNGSDGNAAERARIRREKDLVTAVIHQYRESILQREVAPHIGAVSMTGST